MGFFSKKAPAPDTNETHKMVNAKIHVMQHDLEEVSKNGQVKIESSSKDRTELTPKKPASISKEPLSSDSPFSQPIYPSSNEPLPEKTAPASPEKPDQPTPLEPPQKEAESEVVSEAKDIPTTERASAPLNLPTFEAVPPSTPREPSLPEITKKEKKEFSISETQQTHREPPPKLEKKEDSLRTGTWPVESTIKNEPKKIMSASKTAPKKPSPQKTTRDKKFLPENNIVLKERWEWKRYTALIVILVAISGGAYYFWKTRLFKGEPSEIPLSNIPDIAINPEAEELLAKPEKTLPFSTANPNTFLIDVETETVSTLREKFLKNAETMQQAGMTGPVPFSVVDKTNTPIAFFIFASVFNLGLSGDLLNSLDNDFTLSLFLDNDQPRITLTIKIKDPESTRKYLAASEKTLPLSLKNLLLVETPPTTPSATFSTGFYRDMSLRYFNFSPLEPILSVDYSLVENMLVIGTSKDSARAEIDTILDAKK